MHDRSARAAFYAINLLLSPLTVAGYVVWCGKALQSGRKSGASGTAQGPLFARYFQDALGVREDEPTRRLMRELKDVPALGLNLFATPILLAHRATGYVPRAFRYPFEGEIPPQYEASARVTFFDNAVERYLPEVEQFVLLGAGFDTRALRLPANTPVRSFEVDMPKTQAMKREIVQKAGISSSGVTFVPADFEKEDWLEKLVEARFDPKKKSLLLWEGVIMYLDKGAVEATLRKIASTAKGSVVAFDYMTREVLDSKALYWRYARMATQAAGEPIKFGVESTPPSRDRLAELLEACGLAIVEQRTLGEETEGKRAWGGFAVAGVK